MTEGQMLVSVQRGKQGQLGVRTAREQRPHCRPGSLHSQLLLSNIKSVSGELCPWESVISLVFPQDEIIQITISVTM